MELYINLKGENKIMEHDIKDTPSVQFVQQVKENGDPIEPLEPYTIHTGSYNPEKEKQKSNKLMRLRERTFNGVTISGQLMPPPVMDLIVGTFISSFVFLHVLSILIAEKFFQDTGSIAIPCLLVYLFLLGILFCVGWIAHKFELVKQK